MLVETQANAIQCEQAKTERLINERRFDDLDNQEQLRRRLFLWEWLSAPDSRADQQRGSDARAPDINSGRWLLGAAKFRAWCEPASLAAPLLWINGIPGAGKSVLASLVIDHCQLLGSVPILYFYCRYGDPERETFNAMARSILHQFVSSHDNLQVPLFDAAANSGEKGLRTVKLAEEMLEICLQAIGEVYIVIDGLDECPEIEQQRIARFWRRHVELSSAASRPSRCVFFSQEYSLATTLFATLPSLRILPSDLHTDISNYCSLGAKTIQDKFNLDPQEEAHIATLTAKRADGMFLFAKLVLQNLQQQTSLKELYHEMRPDNFPIGLNEAYSRILNRVLHCAAVPSRRNARRLLAFVSCASRALKWREVQAAVSVDLNDGIVDIRGHRLVVSIMDLCGPLVEEMVNGDIVFVHSSIRHQTLVACLEHCNLAELCLGYFCFEYFDVQITDTQMQEFARAGCYAFMDYALVSWATHLEQVLCSDIDTVAFQALEESITAFFENHWIEPKRISKSPKKVAELATAIQSPELESKVKMALASIHSMLTLGTGETTSIETLSLFSTMKRVRTLIESIASEPQDGALLEVFYGPCVHKCTRLYCRSFYEGFPTAVACDEHRDMHERSHYCSYPGCPGATIGYATTKDLDSHVSVSHRPGPSDEDFPDLPEIENPSRQKHPATFQCSLCPKHFTRAYNLRSHLRSHNGERPFACTICGKGFARQADRKRHEDTEGLH
ncbi:hypothetical protein LTR56_021742 [Elasticomyces elasticus]|nr:hypothetical protein LTR56_021742 [Elasticomyces elasticus]KAK4909120.1 hypothetical protein LTR49_022091 [Elasticomyces elasticus]